MLEEVITFLERRDRVSSWIHRHHFPSVLRIAIQGKGVNHQANLRCYLYKKLRREALIKGFISV